MIEWRFSNRYWTERRTNTGFFFDSEWEESSEVLGSKLKRCVQKTEQIHRRNGCSIFHVGWKNSLTNVWIKHIRNSFSRRDSKRCVFNNMSSQSYEESLIDADWYWSTMTSLRPTQSENFDLKMFPMKKVSSDQWRTNILLSKQKNQRFLFFSITTVA